MYTSNLPVRQESRMYGTYDFLAFPLRSIMLVQYSRMYIVFICFEMFQLENRDRKKLNVNVNNLLIS